MKFDRTSPGGGVSAIYRPENGRALLEWSFCFTGEAEKSATVRVFLTDDRGETVLEGMGSAEEEEPLSSILLQPRLWRGTGDPYLYGLEAVLTDRSGRQLDRIRGRLPLRNLSVRNPGKEGYGSEERDGEELLLNGEPHALRAVIYRLPDTGQEAADRRLIREELQLLSELGADCVCMEGMEGRGELRRFFLRLCDRIGFLTFRREDGARGYAHGGEAEGDGRACVRDCGADKGGYVWTGDGDGSGTVRMPYRAEIPVFRGEKGAFFLPGSGIPTPLFHRYRAKWSREPFVYIDPESIKRSAAGSCTVCCYSNRERLALYSDGALFEFKSGETEFVFRDVPAKSPCIMLTAEGDGCREALSVHKSMIPAGDTGDLPGRGGTAVPARI